MSCLVDVLKKFRKAVRPQQGGSIILLGGVTVELEEDGVADAWSQLQPAADAVARGQIVAGQLSHLKPRQHPVAETQAEGTGDHEQTLLGIAVGRDGYAVVEAARSGGIAAGPVNLVDYTRLGERRDRRHGEIRIAAKRTQELELSGDPAPAAVRTRVIERPVAVDEAEDQASAVRVQQTVNLMQLSQKHVQFLFECGGGVIVVVQMYLNVEGVIAAKIGEDVQDFRCVLLLWVKGGEDRSTPSGVDRGVCGNARPEFAPGCETSKAGGYRSIPGHGLKVVGQRYVETLRRRAPESLGPVAQVGRKPQRCVLKGRHTVDSTSRRAGIKGANLRKTPGSAEDLQCDPRRFASLLHEVVSPANHAAVGWRG
jgi:hypothetical protein